MNSIELKEIFNNCDALLITSGAGMGVDSGLPDFRGTQGFWKAYPPIAKLGLSFSEMANPLWFSRRPKLAWAFYGHRYNLYTETNPHDGFSMLFNIACQKPGGYFVYTSNVDGHFQKAGFDESRIVEVHGSINHFQCTQPCTEKIWEVEKQKINIDYDKFEAIDPLPVCPVCGNLARPNILMFGDWSWIPYRSSEQEEKLNEWLIKIKSSGQNLVIIEIGAGLSVPTVRYKSESVAQNYKATLIRINPRDYQIPEGHFSIPLGAVEGIKKILG